MAASPGRQVRVISDGPLPKHTQLKTILTQLVTNELGPESPIPSERELMQTYEVSRATVRKAIDGLIVDGLLERVHGKGTFVRRPRLHSQLHLASFSQDMRRRGLTPSTRFLTVQTAPVTADAARALGLRPNALAWQVDRVRLADGEPIALEQGWYPLEPLPDLDRQDLSGSLYEVLANEYDVVIGRAEQTLWGEVATGEVARLLQVSEQTPLLVFERTSFAGDQPVEHVVSRYRGDRYQIHMSLTQDQPHGETDRKEAR